MDDISSEDTGDRSSFSFPPSSESLPIDDEPKLEPVAPQGSDFDDLAILNEHLLHAQTLIKSDKTPLEPFDTIGDENRDEESSISSGEIPKNGNSSANSSKSSDMNSIAINKRENFHKYSDSQSANSLPLLTGSLQSPFLSKAAPANPHTTKEDANSVMSRESQTNALAHLDRELEDVDGVAPSPRISSGFPQTGSNATLSLEKHRRTATDLAISFNSPPTSPKIIAHRKSKRTSSEYNFQDILDAASPKDKYDTRMYVDEKFKDTPYRYTTIKRNTDYHQLFRSLDLTDRLLDDFACALSREILLQGRIYISEQYVCFNSSLLGWVTHLIIRQEDIIKFEKRSTAGIFPNGITIHTKDAKHTFASFISRDSTFDFMRIVWENVTGKKMEEDTNLERAISVDTPAPSSNRDEDSNIESFIMSLDGDESKEISNGPDLEKVESKDDIAQDDSETTTIRLVKFKPDCGYKNEGPETHGPTKLGADDAPQDYETELYNDNVRAPLGVVYEILFGSAEGRFFKSFLESQDSSELTNFGEFSDNKRSYSYRKALGYSIGPKSTTCEVDEEIKSLDFNKSIIIESTTKTPDVPLGNSFFVKNKYRFTWGQNNSTNLQITYWIEWTGRSWIKGMIEKLTLTGQTDANKVLIESLKKEILQNTHSELVKANVADLSKTESEDNDDAPGVKVGDKSASVALVDYKQIIRENALVICIVYGLILLVILALQVYLIMKLGSLEHKFDSYSGLV